MGGSAELLHWKLPLCPLKRLVSLWGRCVETVLVFCKSTSNGVNCILQQVGFKNEGHFLSRSVHGLESRALGPECVRIRVYVRHSLFLFIGGQRMPTFGGTPSDGGNCKSGGCMQTSRLKCLLAF